MSLARRPLLALLLPVAGWLAAVPAMAEPLQALRAEVAQALDSGDQPPAGGWQPVSLPDVWKDRWPAHDGVVWYRLQWEQADAQAPVGLLLDYLIMAGSVYVNGSLLHQDRQLSPPLTRAWNTPRYWLIAAPVLQAGTNTMLVRVVGAAAHQAGLGPVSVGPPAEVERLFARQRLLRHDLQLVSLTLCANIVLFFGTLWLMRRKDTVYGWFTLMEICWLLVGINQLATSAWPLTSNDAWHAFNSMALQAFAGCFAVFIWRFSGQRYPSLERAMWTVIALSVLWLAVVPTPWLYTSRAVIMVGAALMVWAVCGVYMVKGWRSQRLDQRILASCVITFVLAGVHDVLVFLQLLDSNIYYASMSAHVLMVGMALVLAWRFVNGLRRIEGFNLELQASVGAARSELAVTLQRQHTLEVANARLSERVNLARDLHDGLGGALVGGISAMENHPEKASGPALLGLLKELRDDLRLIMDSSAGQQDRPLAELLVPLRHRFATLLEHNGIELTWQLAGLDDLQLRPAQSLDLMRFLQEALTNVLKHSQSPSVQVSLLGEGDQLRVSVSDQGVGMASNTLDGLPAQGVGLRSMQARAARLGGELVLVSRPGHTELSLLMPLQPPAVAAS